MVNILLWKVVFSMKFNPANFIIGNTFFATIEDYFIDLSHKYGYHEYLQHFSSTDIESSNNIRLHIEMLRNSKESPTIIIVPGTAIYGFCYAGIMIELYNAGFNVIACDLRGHGRSSGIRGDYSIEELVEDVQHTISYAIKEFNSQVFLLGSSQGAIVSLYTASADDRVKAMVCHTIADLGAPETAQLVRHQNLFKLLRPIVIKAGELLPKTQVPISSYLDLESIKLSYYGNLKKFIEQDPLVLKSISLRALRSLSTSKMYKPIESIAIPTLVISGANDTIFPVLYTKSIYNKLQCKKDFILYENCDHALMHENVDLIHNDIIRWFEAV